MDSPENDQTTPNITTVATTTVADSTSTSQSVALPDSAIFGDINNLSPIKAVKEPLVVTGFPGLSSPSIVFASPHVNPLGKSYSKRFRSLLLSEELCQRSSGGKNIENCSDYVGKYESQNSSTLIRCIEKECDSGSTEDQFGSPSGYIDKYLADTVETRFVIKDNVRQDAEEAIDALSDILKLGGKDFEGKSSVDEKPVETDGKCEDNELPSSICPKHSGTEHKDKSDGVSESLSEHSNSIWRDQDGSKVTGEASGETVENAVLHDAKGQSRGMHRRCLRFEEAQRNTIASNPGSSFSQPVNSIQPISTISSRNCENSRSTVSKPSGIGLHLNSIINSVPKCGSTGGSITPDDKGDLDVHGRKLVSCKGYYPPESRNSSSISLKVRERLSATSQNEEASACRSPQFVNSSDHSLLEQSEQKATRGGKRKLAFQQACAIEELSQSSPQKKRQASKKASTTTNSDGCKRCNCKKTKCLKLYCDCFAAGIYCAESCACQGCFNRPNYEDTVLETRQQIESRNPLAFAPKIVERLTDSHPDSNGKGETDSTPSSARHKRGCNCKKSMCLKKYCECFQGNVGCSSGCRCEGCQNVFGKKEDYYRTKDILSIPMKETIDENVEMITSITPLTPSLQYSDHGKDASKSKFSTSRYLPSPDSDLTLMPKSQGSLGTSDIHGVLLKDRKNNIQGIVSYHQEFDCSVGDTADEFAPTFNGLAHVDDSSRLLNPPSAANANSASSRISDWAAIPLAQFPFEESGHFSSVNSLNRRRSSFDTPTAQFGSAKSLQADSEESLDNILEDDMPETLKDPLNAVKVSSPNKKRVSPPRICSLRQLGSSSSSTGLRSGRKFILRAVPSFPPLTPCIDANDSSGWSKNDPQDL